MADYLRSNKILSTTAVRKIFNCGGKETFSFFVLKICVFLSAKNLRTHFLCAKYLRTTLKNEK